MKILQRALCVSGIILLGMSLGVALTGGAKTRAVAKAEKRGVKRGEKQARRLARETVEPRPQRRRDTQVARDMAAGAKKIARKLRR